MIESYYWESALFYLLLLIRTLEMVHVLLNDTSNCSRNNLVPPE